MCNHENTYFDMSTPGWARRCDDCGAVVPDQCSGPLPGRDVTVVQTPDKTVFVAPAPVPVIEFRPPAPEPIALNTITQGNCLDLLPRVPSGSVDMVLCDLPYGTTQNKWDAVIPFGPLWVQYRRILKPGGAVVLSAQTPFDKTLGASNLPWLKYEWIWAKSKATGHLNANRAPLKEHENILVFSDRQTVYNPQGLVRKAVPTIRKGRAGNGTNYGKSDKDALQVFENYPRSILYFASEGRTVHPTQKPVALWEYLIRTYTNPGDTVLDNCSGSGTTAVACQNTGRNFICFELDPTYCEIAKSRLTGHERIAA